MSITSYAQNFEDVMLWRALGHVPKGFYIDIGAHHPVTDSVSKAFYEKGWRGIHVEATPAYAALLRQDRPDEIVLESAVNDVHGVIRFFEIPASGISTGDPDVARSHQARGFDVHEIVVPCVTLEDIFQQVGNKDIHWLKVDVESMEEQVLRSWGQSPARPWVVVVESTVPLTQIDNHMPWEGSLLERGYTHAYFDGLNRYYLAADQQHLASAFVSGPNVFDGFTLNGDASAPFCAAINERHRLAQQVLQDQLNSKDVQTRQLQSELQAKEQETRQLHEHQANQAAQQQALASKWQAERQALQWQNKEAEQVLALKQLALQELASQRDQESQSQAQNHLKNLVQREQAFAAQLQALQSELNAAQQAALERTIALEIEAREREHALRSKAADDLQQANHQAQARLDALSQSHQHRENALQAEKTQSLQRLAQAHEEFQKQIQALEIETRELEHALRSKAADDLLQANHQAQARLDALNQSHQQREDAHQAEKTQLLQRLEESHAESQKQLLALVTREQAFSEKLQELQAQHQEQARSWTAEQKSLSHQIERLQLDLVSHNAQAAAQAQQHAHLLEEQAAAHLQAMADCAALEEQVKAELLNERYKSEQLSQALVETRSVLAAAQAHWTWRATAPLRALSRSFFKKSFED
jgi:FkbM family methyltransferase